VDTRIALLMREYRHFLDNKALLDTQLDCLVGLHGRARIEEWKSLGGEALVRRLLEEHYDPAYQRSINRNYARFGAAEVVNLPGPDELAFARLARAIATPLASASRAGSA